MKTKKITLIGITAAFAIISLLAFTAFAAPADDLYVSLQEDSESLQDSSLQADDVQEPEGFTVVEVVPEDLYPAIDDALDIEVVGQIGADYIWDMLGESIDGMYVMLIYWYLPERGESQQHLWSGMVVPTRAEVDDFINLNVYGISNGNNVDPLISFRVEAATGERISLDDHRAGDYWGDFHDLWSDFGCFNYAVSEEEQQARWYYAISGLDSAELEAMNDQCSASFIMTDEELLVYEDCLLRQEIAVDAFILESFPALSQIEINEAMEIAEADAKRHFNDSNLVRVDAVTREYYPANVLLFEAEDDIGRMIQINLERETKRFLSVGTLTSNDLHFFETGEVESDVN